MLAEIGVCGARVTSEVRIQPKDLSERNVVNWFFCSYVSPILHCSAPIIRKLLEIAFGFLEVNCIATTKWLSFPAECRYCIVLLLC